MSYYFQSNFYEVAYKIIASYTKNTFYFIIFNVITIQFFINF